MCGTLTVGFVRETDAEPDFPALVGYAGWARLDRDIRRRFEADHARVPVVYRGSMRLERSAIGIVFAAAAALVGGPLPVRAGADVPTDVKIYNDDRGGVVW